eukprot:766424-Hanusia_phi.AAC.1
MAQRRDDNLNTPDNEWRAQQERRQTANNEELRKSKEGRRNSSQDNMNGTHKQHPNQGNNKGKSKQNRLKKNRPRQAEQESSRVAEGMESHILNQGCVYIPYPFYPQMFDHTAMKPMYMGADYRNMMAASQAMVASDMLQAMPNAMGLLPPPQVHSPMNNMIAMSNGMLINAAMPPPMMMIPMPLPPQMDPPQVFINGAQEGQRYGRNNHTYSKHSNQEQNKSTFNSKIAMEMSDDEVSNATSPMLTRILVEMLRDGDHGKSRAWPFFERLCRLSKADVYQFSVMLNACGDSWAAEELIDKMQKSSIEPSEVTYQKLYKIYLRDARVDEAERLRSLMDNGGVQGLPEDYTNRVLTDMLLEMVKEGNDSERRAWELFNRLRKIKKVNIIHYNVMLNTCKSTEDAMQLVRQAYDEGILPSERTCMKLAKLYIKEGNMPSHSSQLDAVVNGLKKTSLFDGLAKTNGDFMLQSSMNQPLDVRDDHVWADSCDVYRHNNFIGEQELAMMFEKMLRGQMPNKPVAQAEVDNSL